MKKTRVDVHFNGGSMVYFFSIDQGTFMRSWLNQMPAVGFYSGHDEKGNYIIINPSQCGAIEITEVNA